MCGNVCIGQTSLLQRFAGNYEDNSFASIVLNLIFCRVLINCERCFVEIYELAGRTLPFLPTFYCRTATGFIFTFTIDSERSFESVSEWYAIMTRARSVFLFYTAPAFAFLQSFIPSVALSFLIEFLFFAIRLNLTYFSH